MLKTILVVLAISISAWAQQGTIYGYGAILPGFAVAPGASVTAPSMPATAVSAADTAANSVAATPTPTPAPTPEEDMKLVASNLNQFVRQLDRPFYFYNWFNSSGHDPVWTSQLSATSISGYDHVKSVSKNYWQAYCSHNPNYDAPDCVANGVQAGWGNMYGPGLYLALDPVATSSYGGGPGWVLMQVQLPQGSRLFDSRTDMAVAFSSEVVASLGRLGCPNMMNLYSLTHQTVGPNYSPPQCLASLRKILRDYVQIDAIYYAYGSGTFSECDPTVASTSRGAALVLANSEKVSPLDVKVFNSQTIDGIADRASIADLFSAAYQNGASYWPDLNPLPTVDRASFMKDHIFGCQGMPFSNAPALPPKVSN